MYVIMEVKCPQSRHKFQRWGIKIIKCMNCPGKTIRLKPDRNGVVTKIYAGRYVSKEEIDRYTREHLSKVRVPIQILRMQIK